MVNLRKRRMMVLRDAKTASYAASFLSSIGAATGSTCIAEAFPRNAVARLDGAGRGSGSVLNTAVPCACQSRLALSSANVMALSVETSGRRYYAIIIRWRRASFVATLPTWALQTSRRLSRYTVVTPRSHQGGP